MNDKSLTAALLLSCPEQKGLVAAVSDFIYRRGGNIIHADQHTDPEVGVFLQRIEWEMAGFQLSRHELPEAVQDLADHFGMSWRLHFSDYVPRIAIFVSKQAHCMYDLLARQAMGEFKAEVPLVIGNHSHLQPIAEQFKVDWMTTPINPENKDEQEARIADELAARRIDVIVLARYMQVLTEDFTSQFPWRIINIHHSFLPAFVGGRPYYQAHERGVKIIGATAHYVTPDLDQGPIIEQDVVRVSHRDTVADLVRRGRDLEKVVLARALNLHLRNRVIVYGNKTAVFD